MKLGEAMYSAQQAAERRRRRPAARAPALPAAAGDEDVVDAEFEEVDDDAQEVGLTPPVAARPSSQAARP